MKTLTGTGRSIRADPLGLLKIFVHELKCVAVRWLTRDVAESARERASAWRWHSML